MKIIVSTENFNLFFIYCPKWQMLKETLVKITELGLYKFLITIPADPLVPFTCRKRQSVISLFTKGKGI